MSKSTCGGLCAKCSTDRLHDEPAFSRRPEKPSATCGAGSYGVPGRRSCLGAHGAACDFFCRIPLRTCRTRWRISNPRACTLGPHFRMEANNASPSPSTKVSPDRSSASSLTADLAARFVHTCSASAVHGRQRRPSRLRVMRFGCSWTVTFSMMRLCEKKASASPIGLVAVRRG